MASTVGETVALEQVARAPCDLHEPLTLSVPQSPWHPPGRLPRGFSRMRPVPGRALCSQPPARPRAPTCLLAQVLLQCGQLHVVRVAHGRDVLLQPRPGLLLRLVVGLQLGQALLVLLGVGGL